MECFKCHIPYNDLENCPRLLISCGHSLCQTCLNKSFNNGTVSCPECRTVNKAFNMAEFPKNLALLHIKPLQNLDNIKRNQPQPHDKSPGLTGNNNDTPSSLLCKKHKKKIEAFCENDRQLLCITCILEEGYKNQEICSINDAAQKEKSLIYKAYELATLIQDKSKAVQKEIHETNNVLGDAADRSRREITNFFNEIRKVLAERETSLKQKLSDQLKKQEGLLKKKEEKVGRHLQSILTFYQEYQKSLGEDDIVLLGASSRRIEIIKQATIDVEKVDIGTVFGELNKENELNSIWKLIQPAKVQTQKSAGTNAFTQGVKNVKTLNSQVSQAKYRSTKDDSNKNSNARGARTNSAFSKESNPNQSFAFSFSDKSTNKSSAHATPQHREFKLNKEEVSFENKKPTSNEKRHFSPSRTSGMKGKHHHGYIALRNQQKEREILRDRSHAGINDISDLLDRSEKLNAHRTSLPATPNKGPNHKIREPSSPEESIGSETAPGVAHQIPYERSFSDKRGPPPSLSNNLQFNQRWMNEPVNFEKSKDNENKQAQQAQGYHSEIVRNVSRGFNEDLYDMWGTEGGVRSVKNNEVIKPVGELSHLGSQTEISTKRDICGSTLCDIADIVNQKLDFSMLCPQTSSYIYTMGGYVEDSQHFIEKYDMQKGKWEIAGTYVNNRTKFSALALPNSGSILILGGKLDKSRTATCEEYCVSDQVVMPSDIVLTSPKSGFGALLLKDNIYIAGGNDGHSSMTTFESYNMKLKKWTTLAPLGNRKEEMAIAAGPDLKIYVIGGFGGANKKCLNEVERYDPVKGIWETIAPLNTARRALAAVTLPDGIYAIGGYDGENYLSTVEKYEESTNEWVFVASMNYPRCTLSAVISSDYRNIFVMGGFDNGPLKTVEKYSVIDGTWEIIQPMHFKRFMHAAVIVNKQQNNNIK